MSLDRRCPGMYRLRLFLFFLLFPALVVGCEEGTVTAPEGEVRGVVMVEGGSVSGVTVELTGPQTRTAITDPAGRYTFDEVPPGAFVVSVRNVPEDASFPATSRTAVVSGSQTVTVDFLGNFIRTASISGSVTAGSQGLAGITVGLEGVESKTTLTAEGGAFQFTGLRAGSYEVELSGLPESVSFPGTRQTVDLSTGESRLVTFEGSAELTASVVIRSIVRRTATGGTEPVDLQNLRGRIDVTLTVDRGEDTLSSVQLLMGEEIVGEQLFDGDLPTPGQIGDEAGGVADSTAPFDIVLSVNTAQFDEATGDVAFPNGPRLLTARLATEEGGPSAWLASVPVQLRNSNTFTGSVVSGEGPLPGDDGEEWMGGPLTVRVLPVLYDPSRKVTSVTVGLRRTGGSQLKVRSGAGPAPIDVVFEEVGPAAVDNVADYQTPVGMTDRFRVITARYEDGASVPGVPATIGPEVRIDNLGPEAATFRLPVQSGESDCCLQNWVGAEFEFAQAVELAGDTGVGGVTGRVHAGDAALSDDEIANGPEVLVGGDLSATQGNSAYRAVVLALDALGNRTLSALAPTPGNALSNPRGAVFGVDLALPELGFSPASVPEHSVNPVPGSAWVIAVTDPVSGTGPLPSRATVRLDAPGASGGDATDECIFPGGGTSGCIAGEDGLARPVPTGVEGYLTYESIALDRAGNRSNPQSRTILLDTSSPTIPSITQLPGSFVAGAPATFAALVSDNVDLDRGWVSLEFGAAGAPWIVAPGEPAVLGLPFDGDLVPTATLTHSVPLLIGLEDVVEGAEADPPSGTPNGLSGARIVAVDAAGNLGTRSTPLADLNGFSPRSFSVSERGLDEGVADWSLRVDVPRVCRSGEASTCDETIPELATLTAEAAGNEGTFERPFSKVHFLLVHDGGEPEWIGVSETVELEEGTGPTGRRWSWTMDWSPNSNVAPGLAHLVAVGVDQDGNALRTRVLDTLEIDG
ncbi:MAG: carboxypeptidase-like regulatory domain-containing protein [Gemmatimonadota bacterium]